MAVSPTQTRDVAQTLVTLLGEVSGLRTTWFVSDTTRPPACVIGQPDIDFADNSSGFCTATWSFPLTVVTGRGNDQAAQTQMSQLLFDIVAALDVDVPDVLSIEALDARPIPVTVGGQELPGYLLNIRIRA